VGKCVSKEDERPSQLSSSPKEAEGVEEGADIVNTKRGSKKRKISTNTRVE
jgi:hypothetical protein